MTDESSEHGLSHLDSEGRAHMVDVAGKPETHRIAVAEAFVEMEEVTLELITSGSAPKGDVIAAARLAGIGAAKKTPELIPLCHPLALTSVNVDIAPITDGRTGVAITARAETVGRTGVEMEALTAAAGAALTVYDMCKAVDRGMTVTDVRLVSKEGGRSGSWSREESAR
jgi:cyclic pyranopterin phosphate synthase